MRGKKLKGILLVTLSCIMASTVPVSAGLDTGVQTDVISDSQDSIGHIQISENHVFTDYFPAEGYKKITLLPSVKQVEGGCFRSMKMEEVNWMASENVIPGSAFAFCTKLKKITISPNVKKIGGLAFSRNYLLENVNLPEGIQSIGYKSFADCKSLKTLYVPETVTEIGIEAFKGCDSLTIHGKKNSLVYFYCKKNNIPFVSEGTAAVPATDRPYIKSTSSKVKNKQIYSTITLDGKVEGADGYQYQIYYLDKIFANKYSKNTNYTFKKGPDIWMYARVRSYKVQNGKKVYSNWSVDAVLPSVNIKTDNLKLTKATGGNRKVTAQFSKLKYSDGFDCVLRDKTGSVKQYVLKNQKKTTVTFKNVKPGTYYLDAHAYTIINGTKKFGAWSARKKVVVK